MKVKAIKVGFYQKLRQVKDHFTLVPHSDEVIIKNRKKESSKEVSSAERKANLDAQFSTIWMEKVKPAKPAKADDADDGDSGK